MYIYIITYAYCKEVYQNDSFPFEPEITDWACVGLLGFCLIFGQIFENYRNSQILGHIFFAKKLFSNFDKTCFGLLLGDFFHKTYLVTLF
jgi:hypothetical protein